jgi:hypothetical protein
MKYLCMIYSEEKQNDRWSKAEFEQMAGEYFECTESFKQGGHYLGGNPLQPTRTATTVRVRNGRTTTTDGPFAETKEQLGGYYLLEARDLNEAIQLAARIPGARYGCIEVRPIQEMQAPVGR